MVIKKPNQNTNQKESLSSPLKEEVKSIGRHSGVYFIGQAVSRAVGFFMIPVYTLYISPQNYGSLEMIEILAGAIGMFIALGVSDSMPRFYYEQKESKHQNLVVSSIVMGLGIIGLPIVLLFLFFSGYISLLVLDDSTYHYYLQISIVGIWFSTMCEVGFTYLRMKYRSKIFVSLTLMQLVLALSLNIYFVVYLQIDILGIFYSTLITQGLVACFLLVIIFKETGFGLSGTILKRAILFGIPIVPSRIATMLGFVSNRFFLRWHGSPDPVVALTQVGLFSLGHKFGVIINRFINSPFNSFWGPRRLELIVSQKPMAKETVARICTYSTSISVYFALLLSCGIESLIQIMADPAYVGAHVVVPFVALSYVTLGLESHFSTGIFYVKKTKWLTYISFVSIAIVLFWNFLFVPKFGLYGAATSNLAGFFFRLISIYIISQRMFSIPFEIYRLSKLLTIAVLIYFLSQLIEFNSPILTFFARTFIAAFFPIFLIIFQFFKTEEIKYIKDKIPYLFNISLNKLFNKNNV